MEEHIKLLMQVNTQQRTQVEQLNDLLQAQIEQTQTLTAKIDELLQRIDELSHKKNSRNNSAPPSSDGYAKPAPKGQRKFTGAKPERSNTSVTSMSLKVVLSMVPSAS